MRLLAGSIAALVLACAVSAAAAEPVVFHVRLAGASDKPVSGRLLVFAKPLAAAQAEAKGKPVTEVDAGEFDPRATAIAALEVKDLAPGAAVDIDADVAAYPQAFSKLAPGRYVVQAVLDQNHTYNYFGRDAGDLVSPVVELSLPAGGDLALTQSLPASDPWVLPADASAEAKTARAKARQDVHLIDFVSPALTRFWGRPVHMRGWIVTPPGYAEHPDQRYPTVYYTPGFGGSLNSLVGVAVMVQQQMAKGETPPMIWALLDESLPTGTHEFADSVNNGPWGEALTAELIPELERQYRMDGRANGRFLNGHSSGGWATLWLQTRYPKLFGGTWSTSPDPSDFHDFTGVDLYAPGGNMYRKADGSAAPIMRDHGKVQANLQDFAQMEAVVGDYGGQMSSFEWVFSPKGEDGRPQPMFDRQTGVIDPAVVAYWREHYDIAYRVVKDWPALKADLDGKIHLYVGTADTFYLDGAAHRLQAALDGVGAKAEFRFIPDRTHFNLYKIGDDRRGLLKQIAWDMYAIARPGSARPALPPAK